MPRSSLYSEDDEGLTSLFRAAESGAIEGVEKINYSLAGKGTCPQQLSQISHKDENGNTAIDIVQPVASGKGRMEFFGKTWTKANKHQTNI